jgi:hypothetical protein
MDIGHTYDTKAQTQWTYKLECMYELWHTNIDKQRLKEKQTNSRRLKQTEIHSSLLRHKLSKFLKLWQKNSNTDSKKDKQTLQTNSKKNWPTIQTNSNTNSKKD